MQALFFFVLCGTNNILRAIALLFCSNFFQSIDISLSLWRAVKSISFQLYWLIKDSILIFFEGLFQYFDGLMPQLMHTKSIYYLFCFYDLSLALLFLNHSGDSIYDLPLLNLVLWRLKYNKSTLSKKLSIFHFFF